jgi:oxidase EvaA
VRSWGQPLFEAQGMAMFGLLTRVNNGLQEFLVRAKPEPGCFDKIELGPTVQLEATEEPGNEIEQLFFERYREKQGVKNNVVLSEEGGRFYHEQNKNVIMEIDANILADPPPGYWWCTYRTLNKLTQVNNILNIQLRNLLSIWEIA